MRVFPEVPDEKWPSEVAFLPYIGDCYAEGMLGHQVLLLGESHYRREGFTDSPMITRPFTRDTFSDMGTLERRPEDGRFFLSLDRMLLGSTDIAPSKAAEAWRKVAFVNLSQEFAGTAAAQRPTRAQLRQGGDILVRSILPILRSSIVLVLGRTAWKGLEHGQAADDHSPYIAMRVNRSGGGRRYIEQRDIWRLDYDGGSAWMTWVYHPSWNVDSWEDRAGVLQHLLSMDRSQV